MIAGRIDDEEDLAWFHVIAGSLPRHGSQSWPSTRYCCGTASYLADFNISKSCQEHRHTGAVIPTSEGP
jgi:hypothetical protein